jgi:hypothetical protein
VMKGGGGGEIIWVWAAEHITWEWWMVNGRVSLRNVRAMDGRRTRFAGEMGGGRFFLTTRKKSIETRGKTINFKCVVSKKVDKKKQKVWYIHSQIHWQDKSEKKDKNVWADFIFGLMIGYYLRFCREIISSLRMI